MNLAPRHVWCAVLALWAAAGLAFPVRQAAAQDAPERALSTPATTTLLVRAGLRSSGGRAQLQVRYALSVTHGTGTP